MIVDQTSGRSVGQVRKNAENSQTQEGFKRGSQDCMDEACPNLSNGLQKRVKTPMQSPEAPDDGGGNLTNTFGDILVGGKYAFANEIGEVKD
eukprot:03990.XXX_38335_38610_1 [CDS] Oithona nana genome sequencing.